MVKLQCWKRTWTEMLKTCPRGRLSKMKSLVAQDALSHTLLSQLCIERTPLLYFFSGHLHGLLDWLLDLLLMGFFPFPFFFSFFPFCRATPTRTKILMPRKSFSELVSPYFPSLHFLTLVTVARPQAHETFVFGIVHACKRVSLFPCFFLFWWWHS